MENMFNQQTNGSMQSLVEAYKFSQNPQEFINNNPQLQQILSMYNGNAKEAFYSLCKQQGVNPDDILKYFK